MKKILALLVAFIGFISCESKQLIINDSNIEEIIIIDCSEKINLSKIKEKSKIKEIVTIINSGSIEPAKFICKYKIIVKHTNGSSRLIILNNDHIKIEGKTYVVQDLQKLLGFTSY
jgi:hypothetical protein